MGRSQSRRIVRQLLCAMSTPQRGVKLSEVRELEEAERALALAPRGKRARAAEQQAAALRGTIRPGRGCSGVTSIGVIMLKTILL